MRIYWAVILSSLLVAGCGTKVTRIDVDETVDLSGAWNDTDSRLVAEEMIADALSHPWTLNFASQSGRVPVVIVGTVLNLSHEHINMNTFVADIEEHWSIPVGLSLWPPVTNAVKFVKKEQIRI